MKEVQKVDFYSFRAFILLNSTGCSRRTLGKFVHRPLVLRQLGMTLMALQQHCAVKDSAVQARGLLLEGKLFSFIPWLSN